MKLPFNPNSKTGWWVLAFIGALLLAYATNTHSEGIAFSAGSAVLRGPAAAIQVEWQWPSWEHRDGHWETGVTMIGPSTYKGKDQTNTFALDASYVDGWGPVDIGIGPAYLQNTDVYNSGGMNFHLMLGYHHGPWFVRYNHFSNSGTRSPNLGRDLVLAGRVL